MTQVIAWASTYALAFPSVPGLLIVMLAGLAVWLAVELMRTRRRCRVLRRYLEIGPSAQALETMPAAESTAVSFENGVSLLSAGFAHDLNNLLVGILANVELLRLSESGGLSRDGLGEIVECAEAAAKLTKQMTRCVGQGARLSRASI